MNSPYSKLAIVVDDDPVARMVCRRNLNQLEFEVLEAEDGDVALELFESWQPDLVLLDVDMERMDGYTTCRQMRNIENTRHCPVIMLTSHEDEASIELAYNSGATDYMPKPVNWTLMPHKIRSLIRNTRLMKDFIDVEAAATMGNWWQIFDQEVFRFSQGVHKMFPEEAQTASSIVDFAHPSERDAVEKLLSQARNGSYVILTHRVIDLDGQPRYVQHRMRPIMDFQHRIIGVTGNYQDVTSREVAARHTRQLAYQDNITRLPNRAAFQESLDNALQERTTSQQPLALIYLDLDDFKRINDSLGHSAGDQLLRDTAKRIMTAIDMASSRHYQDSLINDSDTIFIRGNYAARLGGDEFAIVLPTIEDRDHVQKLADRVLNSFKQQFRIGGQRLSITTSIGVALYPQDGTTSAMLIKNADTAMYAAKRNGKNSVHFYDLALSREAQRRLAIESGLRLAIDRGELAAHYQPQVSLNSSSLAGVEALIRWNSADLGFVSPLDFISVAEETGQIYEIGKWILEESCATMAGWRRLGVQVPKIGVNISYAQFTDDNFIQDIAAALERNQLPPSSLELELTESVLAEDTEGAIRKFQELKQLGVQLSIDDFGTGYSSLSYLKQFPIDRLKIDRSFILDIVNDHRDVAITSSIVRLAQGLGLGVVAEGIEDEQQLQILIDLDCDEVQGYLFAKPMPADEFIEWASTYYTDHRAIA